MLRHFIQKVHQHRFAHPRVVVCVPSGVTGVEKRAVEEATLSAGARQAYLIEEPMAAAIGAGLPVAEPTGNMIVDIGGGTTEVAVISLGGIVVSQSLRVGGDEMDEAIVTHIKKEYKLLVGQQTAEEIKLEVGSAYRMREEVQAEVRGRDMLTGLPKTVVLSSEEIRHALDEPVSQIIDAIKSTLDKTPPELAADIMDRGIVLAGGGALLHGLDERLRHETQMPVHLAESPLTCVAVGSGRSLEEFEAIHRSARARVAPQRPPALLTASSSRPSARPAASGRPTSRRCAAGTPTSATCGTSAGDDDPARTARSPAGQAHWDERGFGLARVVDRELERHLVGRARPAVPPRLAGGSRGRLGASTPKRWGEGIATETGGACSHGRSASSASGASSRSRSRRTSRHGA